MDGVDKKTNNDATHSQLGNIYQFCVALQKIFELDKGESLWIESYGDITTHGEQTEVKHIKKPLRDRDVGFWNTLKNWISSNFIHDDHRVLIFFTTQSFGSKCQLSNWNSLDAKSRFNILRSIFEASENKFKMSQKRNKNINPTPSLQMQRDVFQQKDVLKEIINKIVIANNNPEVNDLYNKIMCQYVAGIPDKNKQSVMNGLLGYVINPEIIKNNKWQIKRDDFDKYFIELTAKYCVGIVRFPRKHIDKIVDSQLIDKHYDKLFVSKIREIEYDCVVVDAISDYIKTTKTIIHELSSYEIDITDYHNYKNDLKDYHSNKYRRVSRDTHIDNVIIASQSFYDDLTSEYANKFGIFQDETPRQFKNGIYHILADDEKGNTHWKLSK